MTRILIVDDSPTFLLCTERLIGKRIPGTSIVSANSGLAAMKRLESEEVDLILTDLVMPDMNGLELVAALKSRHSHVPVILMTSHDSESVAKDALALGAASYVPKQLLASQIVPTIQNILALARAGRTKSRLMSSQIRETSEFLLENDPTLVEPLINLVQEQIVRMKTVFEPDITRLGVAFHEALINAIQHGNLEVDSDLRQEDESIFHRLVQQRRSQTPYKNRRVHVTVDVSPLEVKFVVRDEGPGFDVRKTLDPNREITLERIGGRGLLLISSFLDVVYHNLKGDEITMLKYHRDPEPSTPHITESTSSLTVA